MDISLDGIPIVADQEDGNGQFLADHGAEFLGTKLERAVAYEEDRSARGCFATSGGLCCCFFRGEGSALGCAYGVSDGAPQHLGYGGDVGGELGFPDAEVCGAGFGDDDVGGLEPLADAWPEPIVGYGLRLGGRGGGCESFFVGDGIADLGRR